MAQHPIEIILLRQWASMLSVPIWITDVSGTLVFFNEPTEKLVGMRFEDAGEMTTEEVSQRFELCDLDGLPIPDAERPLVIALNKQQPSHRNLLMRRADGVQQRIAATAIPIIGEGTRHLGAMVMLWESDETHP